MTVADEPLGKVTAFVTRAVVGRDGAHGRELLVFRHPHAGVQLPAGTIEENETPDVAAPREVWEETGLRAVAVVAHLETETTTLPADARAVLRRVRLRVAPAPDAPFLEPPPWFLGLRRGLFVRATDEAAGGFARVTFEEFDGPAHAAVAPARVLSGWAEADAFTGTVVRHFYHLTTTAPTPDAWEQTAEEWDHRFALFWTPLPPAGDSVAAPPDLIPHHARWLERYADRLRA